MFVFEDGGNGVLTKSILDQYKWLWPAALALLGVLITQITAIVMIRTQLIKQSENLDKRLSVETDNLAAEQRYQFWHASNQRFNEKAERAILLRHELVNILYRFGVVSGHCTVERISKELLIEWHDVLRDSNQVFTELGAIVYLHFHSLYPHYGNALILFNQSVDGFRKILSPALENPAPWPAPTFAEYESIIKDNLKQHDEELNLMIKMLRNQAHDFETQFTEKNVQ